MRKRQIWDNTMEEEKGRARASFILFYDKRDQHSEICHKGELYFTFLNYRLYII